ncbi:MAG: GntR family transcriptional regulator [Spirochaetota bacterium]
MSNGAPLYRQITNYLLDQIEQNALRPGDRIPTEQEISEAFGVSRITAVRAVKELEAQGIVSRTKGKGSFVTSRSSWRDNGAAEAPRLAVVSLVLPFRERLALGALVGVEHVAKTSGYHTSFRNSAANVALEREILNGDSTDGIAGLIVYPCSSVDNIGAFSSLLVRRYPLVIIDRRLRGLETPFVAVDNFRGGNEATSHLIELGHHDIAFVAGSVAGIESEAERFRGYCQALVDARVPLRDDLVMVSLEDSDPPLDSQGQPEKSDYIQAQTAGRIIDALFGLSCVPSAIVAINDGNANELIMSALRHGLRVPEQLSVVGFDNLPFSTHREVPLTTVEQPFHTIGERAATMLLSRIANPPAPYESELLEPKLIVRDSTGPPPPRYRHDAV